MRKSIFIVMLMPLLISGQLEWAIYGEVRPSELRADTSWASQSGVEVLFDLGHVEFEKRGFDIVFHRHQRVKIFKADSLESNEFRTLVHLDDRIRRPKATRYRWDNGRVRKQDLQSNDILVVKRNVRSKELIFVFSDLEDGDIIEFAYDQIYEEWRDIDRWWFQTEWPIKRSDLIVDVPEYFIFVEQSSTNLPFDIRKENKKKVNGYDVSTYHYGMMNVPAYVKEPYSNVSYVYRRNLYLGLSSIHIPDVVDREYYTADYKSLVKELSSSLRFGRELESNPFLRPIIDSLDIEDDVITTARALYRYVQQEVSADRQLENQSIRQVHNALKGNPWDVNRYLISLLVQAGFRAHPLLLNSNPSGDISLDQNVTMVFDQLFCHVQIDGQTFVLDATDEDLPFGYIAPEYRVGSGLLIDAEDPRWVDLEEGPEDRRIYSGVLKVDSGLKVQAEFDVVYSDYGAYLFLRERPFDNSITHTDSYELEEKYSDIDSSDVQIIEHMTMAWSLESGMEDSVYKLLPLKIGGLLKNPFVKEFRQQPIAFPAPFERRISYSILLPKGFKLRTIPDQIDLGLPDASGFFRFKVYEIGDRIVVSSQLKIKKKTFYQEEYPYLKKIYNVMVEKHNEELIIERE